MVSTLRSVSKVAAGLAAGLLMAALATGLAAVPSAASGAPPAVAAEAPAAAPAAVQPPRDMTDIGGWIAYREALDLPALPYRARVLYRMGNRASTAGDHEAAVRLWRGAEELDPGYLAPRLTLASHFLSRDPSQGLIEIARIVSLARTDFRLQHFLVSYGLFYLLTALFLATVGVALILCWRHRTSLQHVYEELLTRRFALPRARWWAWGLVVLPFALGLGVAIPAAFTLALLWSYLKRGERILLGLLVAALVALPFGFRSFDRLAQTARTGEGPFYGTLGINQEGFDAARMQEIAGLADSHPDNPFLAFAEGWLAQRGHHYDDAVAAYERAQAQWPREARIANNLGNIEVLRGNADAAESHYRRAIELAPRWAAPHYNLGQLYTARFRYAEASEAIAQATALDFDLVRALQARAATHDGPALAEEWLEPSLYWSALFGVPARPGAPVRPPLWRPWFESHGWAVSVWALLFATVGLALGLVLHHHLPARLCGNCGAAVCRRCATRRRDQILCATCADLVLNATTPEFGRLLLFKRRRETLRRAGRARTIVAALLPGYGAVAYDRVLLGWILAAGATCSGLILLSGQAPFPFDPQVIADPPRPLAGLVIAAFAVFYLLSLTLYFALHGRAREEESERAAAPNRPAPRMARAA